MKAVEIMWVKFEQTTTTMVESPNDASLIVKEVIECSTKKIELEARKHGICLNKELPFTPLCLYGVIPKQTVVDTNTLLYPMFIDLSLPIELTDIKIKHNLIEEEDLETRVSKVLQIVINVFHKEISICKKKKKKPCGE